jgi:hypothetical protein
VTHRQQTCLSHRQLGDGDDNNPTGLFRGGIACPLLEAVLPTRRWQMTIAIVLIVLALIGLALARIGSRQRKHAGGMDPAEAGRDKGFWVDP